MKEQLHLTLKCGHTQLTYYLYNKEDELRNRKSWVNKIYTVYCEKCQCAVYITDIS